MFGCQGADINHQACLSFPSVTGAGHFRGFGQIAVDGAADDKVTGWLYVFCTLNGQADERNRTTWY